MARTYFITGTDTNVGKTVLTSLLIRHLRKNGANVRAAKPICSGGREDAQAVCDALAGGMTLDQINPWHFTAPIAPLLAARRVGRKVWLKDVVQHLRTLQQGSDTFLIEGAGGLLSPMGEDFSSLELIQKLRAVPVVVCPNRLGAVNQSRLVLAAMPRGLRKQAHIVLVSPARPDATGRSNKNLLGEFFEPGRIHSLPWLTDPFLRQTGRLSSAIRRCLDAVISD